MRFLFMATGFFRFFRGVIHGGIARPGTGSGAGGPIG